MTNFRLFGMFACRFAFKYIYIYVCVCAFVCKISVISSHWILQMWTWYDFVALCGRSFGSVQSRQ